ncbi:MAG: 16S rRNA (cytidine(1402)-2'-O)-methyltransferase [Candidatus Omnitrophica bacterium CG07_land_8_20_14_0_80_50_8]|nr:MAG: 16S rRNA (cytidine(1402)-2'-O)-methyltransferase [Candidatus Omnitrophica bacterium CG1_02_49_16]PIU39734.1 MAG: 16S rRNA (cytidine(1402)-2'-O)-methyltransferase [Candidatus Omnitrophica bacterium CG07_land_8_20_14_0_80_50_8]
MNTGTLYLVSTPIGNLGDITFRAVEILKSVDLIACEDTRHSRILLDHYDIRKPLVSYHNYSEKERAVSMVEKIKNGTNVALISDAGTPGIADPGYRLIAGAIREGIRIETLPGASAILPALVLSGLPVDRFMFEGFFPVKSGQRKIKLLALKDETRTVIFYESPHRLLKTLAAIQETLGDIEIVVARELTKKFEEVLRKKVSETITYFSNKKILGELVVLFNLSVRKGL